MALRDWLPPDHFCRQFARKLTGLFNNRELADIEITVGQTVIPAHRLVLCLQSRYFSDALTGNFKEGQKGTLKCEPGREQAYLRVLQYLYSGDYDVIPSTLITNDDDPALQMHSRVYFLADSLFLTDLKVLALEKFERQLDDLWAAQGVIECIAEIYNNTVGANELRAVAVRGMVQHYKHLIETPAFEALLREVGDFAVDIVKCLTNEDYDY